MGHPREKASQAGASLDSSSRLIFASNEEAEEAATNVASYLSILGEASGKRAAGRAEPESCRLPSPSLN